jgi:hypothetical protein
MRFPIISTFIFLLIAINGGMAADGTAVDPAAIVDFALPENSAAAILNSTIPASKPTTPRDFAAGINSLVDKDGKLQPGISLGFAPYRLFAGHISADDYKKKPALVFLSRMQASLATLAATQTAGASSKGVLVGAGLNFTFIDHADPRGANEVSTAFGNIVKNAPILQPNPEADDAGSTVGAKDAVLSQRFQSYLQKWRQEHWNSRSFGGGLAWRGNSSTSAIRDAKDDGWAAWLTYADKVPGTGLLQNGLFLANAQYRKGEVVEESGVQFKRDAAKFSAQLRFGSADFNGYAEVFYRRFTSAAASKSEWSAEIGAEWRVSEGTWLNASWVEDANGKGDSAVRAGLRFGMGKGPKWSRQTEATP